MTTYDNPPASGSTNLSSLPAPSGPLVPDWAAEAVRRINMIMTATVAQQSSAGGYGGAAFSFSGGSCRLILPAGISGNVALAKLTSGGQQGSLTIVNGLITAINPPT